MALRALPCHKCPRAGRLLAYDLAGRAMRLLVVSSLAACCHTRGLLGLEQNNRFIGVLDIFGFEIFATNSLEQLCINFANEKLQRNFTETTFRNEEGLYAAEGIDFDHIEYIDNSAVLELLEGPHGVDSPPPAGILPIIDDETKLPEKSDLTLLDKLNTKFASKATPHPKYGFNFKTPSFFMVRHYAGEVIYSIEQFLEKSVRSERLKLIRVRDQCMVGRFSGRHCL